MEQDLLEKPEQMEVVDIDREDRLDRVRRRQLQWATSQLCKSMVLDMVDTAVCESSRRVCKEVMMENIVYEAWAELEFLDIMKVMGNGDISLRTRVEERLREDRKLLELEEATMMKMRKDKIRKSKVEALKKLWNTKRLQEDIRKMTEVLDTLELDDWNLELEEIVTLLDKMILEMPTIAMGDVDMTDPREELQKEEIVWAAEVMDTDVMVAKDVAMETESNQNQRIEESVMIVVSHVNEEPHHHGGLLAPVQDQTIMPEKGLESGSVLGVQCTDDPMTGASTPTRVSKYDTGLAETSEARLGCDNVYTVYTESEDPYDKLNTGRAGLVNSKNSVKYEADMRNALSHPISKPQENPEAFARIEICPDEVSLNKLKTGEIYRSGPAVGSLLGV
jgi:hypothetical protein